MEALFADRIEAASAASPLIIRGGGSKDFYGRQPRGEVLDVRGHAGVISYEPTELVVTARCGTSLAELEALLATKGQFLPFEAPAFRGVAASAAAETTLGGVVAAGLSGPRRATAGAVRDFILGVKLMDCHGRVLSFGGQVMKNVAGYDVSRLMAGSLGTLGLILEVSVKVLPRPVAEATLRFAATQDQALEMLHRWGGQPIPLSASSWQEGVLWARFSGASAAVDEARGKLGGEPVPDREADAHWQQLRHQSAPFFAGDEPLWRFSLPATTPALDLPGPQLIEWGGSQRWWRGPADAARREAMQGLALSLGGHATLFRGGDRLGAVFQSPSPAVLALQQRVARALDPRRVFATGRLFAEG